MWAKFNQIFVALLHSLQRRFGLSMHNYLNRKKMIIIKHKLIKEIILKNIDDNQKSHKPKQNWQNLWKISTEQWHNNWSSNTRQCFFVFLTILIRQAIVSFSDGIFLNELKIAQVSPIYKANDAKLSSNYRPISLLSIFSKLSDNLMYYWTS